MKILSNVSKMFFQLIGFFAFFVLSLVSMKSLATEAEYTELVEIEEDVSVMDPYSIRRGPWGSILTLDYVALDLSEYLSTLDNTEFKTQYNGNSLTGGGISLQWKKNWSPISISAGPFYQTASTKYSNNKMKFDLIGLTARVTLDGLSDNPKYCPFASIDLWQGDISESNQTESFSGKISSGYSWKAGLLVNLGSFDTKSADTAYLEAGIQATYLGLWANAIGGGLGSDDPDVQTSPAFGAGLTLEF